MPEEFFLPSKLSNCQRSVTGLQRTTGNRGASSARVSSRRGRLPESLLRYGGRAARNGTRVPKKGARAAGKNMMSFIRASVLLEFLRRSTPIERIERTKRDSVSFINRRSRVLTNAPSLRSFPSSEYRHGVGVVIFVDRLQLVARCRDVASFRRDRSCIRSSSHALHGATCAHTLVTYLLCERPT